MMQSLRENMKLIIWITAIVFLVGFGILELGGVVGQSNSQGQGPKGVIATINGDPVRYQDFNQLYTQMVQQLTAQRAMQEGEDSYVREQAWQQIVRAKLMEQEARRRHIQVTRLTRRKRRRTGTAQRGAGERLVSPGPASVVEMSTSECSVR